MRFRVGFLLHLDHRTACNNMAVTRMYPNTALDGFNVICSSRTRLSHLISFEYFGLRQCPSIIHILDSLQQLQRAPVGLLSRRHELDVAPNSSTTHAMIRGFQLSYSIFNDG